MSSPDEENDSETFSGTTKRNNGSKKKRVRACDACRRRKGTCSALRHSTLPTNFLTDWQSDVSF
jgi:hypothetical protein